MNTGKIYEKYHSKIKLQKNIVGNKNFTYRNTLFFIDKYFKHVKNVLDIGCGVGTLDFYLASKGKKVLGIDISKNAIEAAKDNSKVFGLDNKIKFSKSNFSDQKVNGKYGGILISEVLEHLKDDKMGVKKISDLSKHGTIIIASSPSKNAPLFKLGLLKSFDKRVGHLRRYTSQEFSSLFTSNGFEILELVKTEGIIRNLLFTNSAAGKLVRIIRGPISDFVTMIDNITIPFFGESDYYIIARKK